MDTQYDIQQQLAKLWRDFDPKNLVNEATAAILDDPGDWDPPAGITPKLPSISLAIGIPDTASLPKKKLMSSSRKVFSKPGDSGFVYGFGMGYTRLRAQLAQRYTEQKGLAVTEDWFQLCNGSSGAIDLICRTLIQPGDVIIVESPTYMGTLRNFHASQAEVHAVSMDEEGLMTTQLETLIARLIIEGKRIKFIYTISTFHNPTGITLSHERRIDLLRLAAKYNILILDDDAYGELYFGAKPPISLSTLCGGYGVLTVGTFSKIIATGLRIGWIHGHPDLVRLFGKMRFAMGLNQLTVRIVSDFIDQGHLETHANLVRSIYREKMQTLVDALQRAAASHIEVNPPEGGFYLWIKLKSGIQSDDIWRTAAEEGIAFTRGINFYPTRPESDAHIRMAFPWTHLDKMESAASRFGKACERVIAGDIPAYR